MPILDEIAHNGFRLYRLAPKPLPQLVLVCHGGHGESKTVAGRDLSFYSKEDMPAILAADATVKFLSGEGVGFSPDNKQETTTWGLQNDFIHRNKTVYNYHLYGEGDVIAMGGMKENFDQVVTPAMDLAFPIPGRRRKLSDFWEFLGWLERKLNVRNLYPMVHCHFCRTPVGG